MIWRTTITLSIVAAFTAGIARAQPAAEPKPADPADKAKVDEDARRLEDQLRAEKAAAANEARREADQARREVDQARRAMDQQRRAMDQARRDAEQQLRTTKRLFTPAGRAADVFARPTRKEKVAYLGVATMEVSPELASHLKLSPGMGLVVNMVLPDSPAERAGVKQYDVITRLDDQMLTNPEQLRVLVRMKKQSDDVKLSVIRQGAPTSVSVELGQQEVDVEIGADPLGAAGAEDMPRGLLALRDGKDGKLNFTFTPAANDFVVGGWGGMAMTNANGKNQMVWSDAQHTLQMELQDGKASQLTVRSRDGKEIFKGPVATDEERKALPAEIADKLRKAEAGGPMRFAMTPTAKIRAAANRARTVTSTDQDRLLVARIENGKAVHAFAFSQADGKTLFDGAVADDEQRKAMPAEILKQLETLEKNPDAAAEFGVVGKQR
jgi:hypothetical protein